MVRYGLTFSRDGKDENFNIVIFLVADLSFVKEILGKASCTQQYGCFHCELDIKSWASEELAIGEPQSIKKMEERGQRAFKVIGVNPNKDGAIYKKFIKDNFGQWVSVFVLYVLREYLLVNKLRFGKQLYVKLLTNQILPCPHRPHCPFSLPLSDMFRTHCYYIRQDYFMISCYSGLNELLLQECLVIQIVFQ